MVLAVEPDKVTSDGIFHMKENVVVTATGHEIMAACDWKLREGSSQDSRWSWFVTSI
jgi:hypothetical protein